MHYAQHVSQRTYRWIYAHTYARVRIRRTRTRTRTRIVTPTRLTDARIYGALFPTLCEKLGLSSELEKIFPKGAPPFSDFVIRTST